MRGLDGRRVIMTGGASGIGRAAALRLARKAACSASSISIGRRAGRRRGNVRRRAALRVDITDRGR